MNVAVLKNDIVIQWRSGFWLVYLILGIIYLSILFGIPEQTRFYVTAVIIFMDSSVLGMVFIGAQILLEKQQSIIQGLFVTPMKLRDYILSKTFSISLLAIVVSAILLFLPNGFDRKYIWVMLAVFLSAPFYTLIGIAFSTRTKTINGYFIMIMLSGICVSAPLVPFLILDQHILLLPFPTNASIDLFLLPFKDQAMWRIALDVSILLFWCFLAYKFALKRFTALKNHS